MATVATRADAAAATATVLQEVRREASLPAVVILFNWNP
jgi:hypothetical protein